MDDFALNGAAINGEANEWVTLEGSTEITLAGTLEGKRGATIVVNEQINFETSAAMSAGIRGDGTVLIELDASLMPAMLTTISGDMQISLDAEMAAAVRVALAGSTGITLDTNLDVLRWALGQGLISIDFALTGEGRIVQRIEIEGECGIVLDPMYLNGRRTPAHLPEMPLLVDLELGGPAWLKMQAQGNIEVSTMIEGIGRIGGKVQLEGATEFELLIEGDTRRFAMVPVEGVADIQFLLVSELAGRPVIPVEYVPAPNGRRFAVARGDRRERVLINDRSL